MPTYPDDMEIAPNYTVKDWKELKLTAKSCEANWEEAIEIIEGRIKGRYLDPVDILIAHQNGSDVKFGFAILAIDFIVIETLQGFRCGIEDHHGESKKLITKFLKEWPLFQECTEGGEIDNPEEKVYSSYRCALLHSGATDGDLRVGVSGPAFDFKNENKIKINRTVLHKGLKCEFIKYVSELREFENKGLRKNFITKMNYICGVQPQ